MKKWLLALLCIPTSVFGFYSANESELVIQKSLDDDLYIAGESIALGNNTKLEGDFIGFGEAIFIEGIIVQDLMVMGANISITGKVMDDVRAAGANLLIEGIIEDDAMLAGDQLTLSDVGVVGGDLNFIGSKAVIEGEVLGSISISASEIIINGRIGKNAELDGASIKFGKNAEIRGDLTYSSSTPPEGLDLEMVTGDTVGTLVEMKKENIIKIVLLMIGVKLLFIFVFSSLLFFALPKFFQRSGKAMRQFPLKNFLRGLMYFFITPLLILLLLASVIGIPVGLFVLGLFIFSFILVELINVATLVGALTYKDKSKKLGKKWLLLFLFSLLSTLVVGLDILLGIWTFGAVISQKAKLLRNA